MALVLTLLSLQSISLLSGTSMCADGRRQDQISLPLLEGSSVKRPLPGVSQGERVRQKTGEGRGGERSESDGDRQTDRQQRGIEEILTDLTENITFHT